MATTTGGGSANGTIPRKGKKHVWRDEEDGQWYWNLTSGNGQVVTGAWEGYSRKSHAVKMMEQVLSGAYAHVPVHQED